MYGGQAMIHTSGALGAEVLAPAMAAGTQIGAFHPLVAFADTERAVAALHGATVAIEGDDQLAAMLADMAEAIGATPVRLAPGSKAAYHAAAVLAAGGFVALLDAIAELGRVAGLDEAGLARDLRPAHRGDARQCPALGIRAALTGPMTRGDVGTLEAHLDTLRAHAPGVLELYVAAARPEIDLAEGRGALAPEASNRMRELLVRPCKPRLNRYHSLPWITASRPSTRPARQPDSSAPRRASGSADWASPVRLVPRAGVRSTVLLGAEVAPLARLRAGWRAIHPAVSRRQRSGRPRPLVAMEWARSGRPGTPRRPGAASAPWPA